MCYIGDMKEIVTSWTDFERLVKAKVLVYVDKTAYVHRLVRDYGGFYFISRPRRFGKSLMCSTLDALFSGKKELFEGLRIARTDYSFRAYPVLRFDFSKPSTDTYEDFLNGFRMQIRLDAARYGLKLVDAKPAEMMDELLSSLVSPVIIIDEFDSAVIDAVSRGKTELAESMRVCLNSFYKVIKSHTGNIRFLFITGCTKLSGLSIFSAMNNLRDISLSPEYASCFGYTEDELLENFSEHIDEKFKAGEYGTREEFISALRNYYDGYRFSPRSETRVYNPVSIGNYFSDSGTCFNNYWMYTGGMSTLAVSLSRSVDLIDIADRPLVLNMAGLAQFDISLIAERRIRKSSVVALLYYAGYLTITDAEDTDVSLYFPNTEVRTTFLSLLAESYSYADKDILTMVNEVVRAARRGRLDTVISVLNEYYRGFNYTDLKGNKEQAVRILFKAFFHMLRYPVFSEVPGGKGIIDTVLLAGAHDYIFEFKVDGKTSTDAFMQILDRHYPWLLPEDGKTLHLVGIDFRTEKQQIVSYTHQVYDANAASPVDAIRAEDLTDF